MTTRTFCEMVFDTALDRTRAVRFPQPCPATDADMVNHVAGLLINADPFDNTIGQLMSLRRADKVSIHRIKLI